MQEISREFTAPSQRVSLESLDAHQYTFVETVLLKIGIDWINHSSFFLGNCKDLFLD